MPVERAKVNPSELPARRQENESHGKLAAMAESNPNGIIG
jgi:hypothetical protein